MKNMNLDLSNLSTKLLPWLQKARRYFGFIFMIALLGIYGFLIFRINTLNNQEPADDDVTAKLKTVQRPKIDQSVIDKIQQLQDNSVDVKSLFNKARDNPFQE